MSESRICLCVVDDIGTRGCDADPGDGTGGVSGGGADADPEDVAGGVSGSGAGAGPGDGNGIGE